MSLHLASRVIVCTWVVLSGSAVLAQAPDPPALAPAGTPETISGETEPTEDASDLPTVETVDTVEDLEPDPDQDTETDQLLEDLEEEAEGWPATGEALLDNLNSLERETILELLDELGLTHDADPSGKRFGEAIIVPLEVFRVPSLQWLNVLHVTTRTHIIEQEFLWQAGDAYDGDLVAEAARNLRGRQNFSIVAIIPVQSDTPGEVDLLAVARDTWSLRLAVQVDATDGVLNQVYVALNERNVAGLHKWISAIGLWEQDTLQLGGLVIDPRIAGTRFTVQEDFRVVLNHDTWDVEGTLNAFSFRRPLYSLDTRWGFGIFEVHDISIDRLFIGDRLRTYDNPDTLEVEAVPFEIDQVEIDGLLEGSYSQGHDFKHILSFGYGLSQRQYDPVASDLSPEASAAFSRDVLPRSEFASFVTVGYTFFEARWESLRDLQTFAFTEDFRVGPSLESRLDAAPTFLGSDVDFLRGSLALGYTAVVGDAVFESSAEISSRLDLSEGELIDRRVEGLVRFASPMLGFFRIHLGGAAVVRFNRVTESLKTLGGDTGLRGFATGAFIGDSILLGHLELRTAPLELLTQYFGLVLFYDAGTAFFEDEQAEYLSNVGLGLRWVVPQFQTFPIRVDYAFPLTGPSDPLPGVLTFGLEQAF